MSSAPGPALRAALFLAAASTAASVVSVIVILGVHFAQGTPHPALFWVALWGLPVGFALLCGYVVLALVQRRRLRIQP